MADQIKGKEIYWQTLWFNMAEGKQVDIEVLKRLDIFEFYSRLEVWEHALEQKLEKLREMQNT